MSGESNSRGGTRDDHLTALFFSPIGSGSHGTYRPGMFDLHLNSGEDLTDQLVHHHELQHVVLTAATSWGGALLVASRVPGWSELFGELLEHCRTTHESYATYMSCSAVKIHSGSPDTALAAYPHYIPLVERLDQYLAAIQGDHRRSLAVTALARVCMQTPILRQIAAAWPRMLAMSSIRALDRPDERLSRLLRTPGGFPAVLATAADAAMVAKFGPEPLAAALIGDDAVVDDRFDPAWALWEDAVFDALAAGLTTTGAAVASSDDHVAAGDKLVALVRHDIPDLGVTIVPDPKAADRRIVTAVLQHARLWLSEPRRPARMVSVGPDIDVAEAVRVATATTRVGGRPNFVLHARLPVRLLDAYALPEVDHAAAAGLDGPVLVSRTIADDGTDTNTDVLWLVRWPEPADVRALAASWAGQGDLTCCVAVSCLADKRWYADWAPVLAEAAPLIWLIDVPIASLAARFGSGRTIHSIYLDLGPISSGARQAVAFKDPDWPGVWLAVADDVGIQLITQQVAGLPGIELRTTGADWSRITPALRLTLLDLLRTESYADLRAWSDIQS